MPRRRFVVLIGLAVLAGLAALAAVLAPEGFDAAVERGADTVEQAPEPVVLGVTTLALSVVSVFALVYILRAYYWAWLQVEGPLTRFWEALVPESPILRFGLGITVMALLFLVGPLVVLAELDFLDDGQDPVEEDDTDSGTDTSNGTSTGGDGNSTGDGDTDESGEPTGGGSTG
jgi:hypothetical protein